MDNEYHDLGTTAAVDSAGPPDRFRFLTDPRRVAILSELAATGTPLATADLARRVAAREGGKPVSEVSSREERIVYTSLQHTHLPKLATHSLLEWDRTDDTVSLPSDVSIPRLLQFLGDRSWTASSRLLRTLAHPRRRLVVGLLGRTDTPLSIDDLARLVAAAETGGKPDTVSAQEVDRIRVSLIHSHLPALSAAGIISFDEKSGVVTQSTATE